MIEIYAVGRYDDDDNFIVDKYFYFKDNASGYAWDTYQFIEKQTVDLWRVNHLYTMADDPRYTGR